MGTCLSPQVPLLAREHALTHTTHFNSPYSMGRQLKGEGDGGREGGGGYLPLATGATVSQRARLNAYYSLLTLLFGTTTPMGRRTGKGGTCLSPQVPLPAKEHVLMHNTHYSPYSMGRQGEVRGGGHSADI